MLSWIGWGPKCHCASHHLELPGESDGPRRRRPPETPVQWTDARENIIQESSIFDGKKHGKKKKTRFPVAYRNKLADLGPSFSRGWTRASKERYSHRWLTMVLLPIRSSSRFFLAQLEIFSPLKTKKIQQYSSIHVQNIFHGPNSWVIFINFKCLTCSQHQTPSPLPMATGPAGTASLELMAVPKRVPKIFSNQAAT